MATSRRIFMMAGAGGIIQATTALAQTGNSTLSGLVTYRGGNLANARIYLGREGKYRSLTVKFRAGKNIGYSIPALTPGRYELIAAATGARPRRIWGVKINSFEEKQLNVVLEPCAPADELFYTEEGTAIREDMPRTWGGGWLQSVFLTEQGAPVEGTIKVYRGFTVAMEQPTGSPTLPAYFETRDLQPGTYDLLFVPSLASKLKPIKLEKVTVDMNVRTVLDPVKVPPGFATDAPQIMPAPNRQLIPVPQFEPRRRRTSG